MNSVTESSGPLASTLGSTPYSATTTDQNHISSLQIDKADRNLSSYHSTRNEGQIGATATFIPAPTPPTPPSPSLPSALSRHGSLAIEVSTERTDGTQVGIDENKAQSAYLPSDDADPSQLSPVWGPSQSEPYDQAQSATSPLVSQNTFNQVSHSHVPANSAAQRGHQLPSQYSQESYHVPTAQAPQINSSRTSGGIRPSSPRRPHQLYSDPPPSLLPKQHITPLRQSAITPQPHSWGPTQPFYGVPNVPTPQTSQSIHEGIHQQFVSQSAPPQSYGLPGAPTPLAQSIHGGVPQPFISQMAGSPFEYLPLQKPFPTSRKANVYVASDPFRVSDDNDKVDAPSDGLTFDDIPTAGSVSGPNSTTPFYPQPAPSRFHRLPNDSRPQAQLFHGETRRPFIPSHSTPNEHIPQDTQSVHSGIPEQENFPQPVPPQFSSAPTTHYQSIHAEPPQPPQMSSSQFGPFPNAPYVPSRFISHAFVASDPFQTSREDKVDAPSTFDDIPIVESAPGPRFMQGTPGMVTSPYGALPTQPTFGGYFPNSAPPVAGAYGQRHNSTQPGVHSTLNGPQPWYRRPQPPLSNVPGTQIPIRQSSWSPNGTPSMPPIPNDDASEHRRPSDSPIRTPPFPPFPEDDDSEHKRPALSSERPIRKPSPLTHPQPEPPTSMSSPQVQTEAPSSPVPSSQYSAVIPPPLPLHPPSRPQEDIPFTPYEPQTANQSPFGPYVFHSPYVPYPPYPPHLQHQHDLPRKPIFSRLTRFFRSPQPTHTLVNPQPFTAIYPPPFTQPYTVIYPPLNSSDLDWHAVTLQFLLVTFPKQMYLVCLLRLPSLYFSRVARIFEEADLSLPEIKKMALETASQGLTQEFEIEMAFESPTVPPAYKRLTTTWESFIDSVMREWKIFNIISVLLLSAILSVLQIQSAAEDPLIRYTAIFSLVCALISLLFGCMYIIRFGTMRKTYKAAEWALEAQKTKTLIWWNVWVLLAMPAIWLTWSIILYFVCIMSFVWRTGVVSTTSPELSDTGLLVIRVFITTILGIGVLYGFLIMTTFQRYGAVMDRAWKQRIDKWIEEKVTGNKESYPSYWSYPDPSRMYQQPAGNYPMYRRAFDHATDRYPGHTPFVPSPRGSPHVPSSTDTPAANNLSNLQDRHDGVTAAATPPPLDLRETIAKAEEPPPRLIPETAAPIPESPLAPLGDLSGEDNVRALASGLENRGGGSGDAPGDRNRVRFRLPSS